MEQKIVASSAMRDREFELKFELPPAELDRLDERLRQKGGARAGERKTLRSIYFDTPGHDLQKAMIALRLRNDGGKRWLQTVKTGEARSGLSNVGEVETRVEGCVPDLHRIGDKRLRRKIEKICRKVRPEPVFETLVERRTHVIARADCIAELALDLGRIDAHGRSRDICEAELELRSGTVEGLLAIAREVFADFPIRPSESSKAARGFRLVTEGQENADPVHSSPIARKKKHRARDVFAAILQSAGNHIVANQRLVLERGDDEAVHQMRVGLTRLRSALRSLMRFTRAAWVRELESDAQQVARIVGPLRDADVLIAEIYAPIAAEHAPVPGFPGLLDALNAHRAAIYAKVPGELGTALWSRLLVTMILSPHLIETRGATGGGGLDGEPSKAARQSLERCWERARSYGARIETLDLEERHSMRKALKKLRYNCEFFQTLYKGKARRFIERLKKLQELFGVINDARMAEQLIGIALAHPGTDPATLAAAGYILGRNEAMVPHVWSEAKSEWKRLEKAAGFWR